MANYYGTKVKMYAVNVTEQTANGTLQDTIVLEATSKYRAQQDVLEGLKQDGRAMIWETVTMEITQIGKRKAQELAEGDARFWCEVPQ